MPSLRHTERNAPRGHPVHDSIFGDDAYLSSKNAPAQDGDDAFLLDDEASAQDVDDTPHFADRNEVNLGGTAVQPESNQPMRNLGDTDQGDRQPDSSRRR